LGIGRGANISADCYVTSQRVSKLKRLDVRFGRTPEDEVGWFRVTGKWEDVSSDVKKKERNSTHMSLTRVTKMHS
jgi:hypothetical protein